MDFLIYLYLLLAIPKLLWDRFVLGKRHPEFFQRMGARLPNLSGEVFWIHAVSVGEIKSVKPLLLALRQKHPNAKFFVTTTTHTGFKEAKRSLTCASYIAYSPVDLSFVVKRFIRKIKPTHYILVESDFWPNLLRALKNNGTNVFLVSGKISERSFKRFSKFPFLARRIFSKFNTLCVQNELYKKRFEAITQTPTVVTGNLKLDQAPQKVEASLQFSKPVIVLSCTHESEEEMLLDQLQGDHYCIVVAPRHPERFEHVAKLLMRKKISFVRFNDSISDQKVLLVDQMGKLAICYSAAHLVISGGSFVTHIGGHNILEPLVYGVPVIFGPHMFGQQELVKRVLESGAGRQLEIGDVKKFIREFFENQALESQMKRAALKVIQEGRGSTEKTLTSITHS